MANKLGTIAVTTATEPGLGGTMDGQTVLFNGEYVAEYYDNTTDRRLMYHFKGDSHDYRPSLLTVSTTLTDVNSALFGTVTNEVISLTALNKGERDIPFTETLRVKVQDIIYAVTADTTAGTSYVYIKRGGWRPMRYLVDHTLAEIIALV